MDGSVSAHPSATGADFTGDAKVDEIIDGLDFIAAEMHPLKSIVHAFRGLLVERARFKAELKDPVLDSFPKPDPSRFGRGVPLTTVEELIESIDETLWVAGARRLMPAMEEGFPRIRGELEIIGRELIQGRLNPREVFKVCVTGDESHRGRVASGFGVGSQSLAFALGQIARPLMEKVSAGLGSLLENLSWTKGYCPICGTMPELAFLQNEGGQRWLRCASCSHEWRFTVLTCPFCESQNHDDFEIYFVADREYEVVDVCHKCRRYLPTIDTRKWPRPIARDVAAMTLMHLDVIAQEKGFLPAAVGAWNIVEGRDISGIPIPL